MQPPKLLAGGAGPGSRMREFCLAIFICGSSASFPSAEFEYCLAGVSATGIRIFVLFTTYLFIIVQDRLANGESTASLQLHLPIQLIGLANISISIAEGGSHQHIIMMFEQREQHKNEDNA